MPTVYAVHPVKDDIGPATDFGGIVYINQRYLFGDELTGSFEMPRFFLENINKAADAFRVQEDKLLIAGDHLQILQMSVSIAKRYGSFEVLRYDRIIGRYFVARIQC